MKYYRNKINIESTVSTVYTLQRYIHKNNIFIVIHYTVYIYIQFHLIVITRNIFGVLCLVQLHHSLFSKSTSLEMLTEMTE